MHPTHRPQWKALQQRQATLAAGSLAQLFDADRQRSQRMTFHAPSVSIDLSRNRIDRETLDLLVDLARASEVERMRDELLAGGPINNSEQRPAWHTALRSAPADEEVAGNLRDERGRFLAFADALRAGGIRGATNEPIQTVVCIGIGGSDLGPRLVTEALGPGSGRPVVRFVANIDPAEMERALAGAVPETTLLVAISKNFTTLETLENARAGLDWLQNNARKPLDQAHHIVAVTAHPARAVEFGIHRKRIFTFPDWVGGRYSVWSACGIGIAIAHGHQAFEELLAGAAEMDAHFAREPLATNVPVLLGLLGAWYVSFWGVRSRAVFPYAQRLRHLPGYLQQLEMESNGKRVDREHQPVDYDTSPVVWGEVGSTAQHSVFQYMHQGSHWSPADFVVVAQHAHSAERRHRLLYACAQAQIDALAFGDGVLGSANLPPPYAVSPGNRPTTLITLPQLDARSVGSLLAMYEHRTFVQGVLWNVNSYDQWGVEIGKTLLRQRLAQAPI